jgi:hypothetical protein
VRVLPRYEPLGGQNELDLVFWAVPQTDSAAVRRAVHR